MNVVSRCNKIAVKKTFCQFCDEMIHSGEQYTYIQMRHGDSKHSYKLHASCLKLGRLLELFKGDEVVDMEMFINRVTEHFYTITEEKDKVCSFTPQQRVKIVKEHLKVR